MKLIDKDSLLEIMMKCNKPLADGYHMKDYVFNQIITDINNEPIVEAIPISFIKEKIKSLKPQARWESKNLDGYETHYANDEIWYLKKLVEDWRKENNDI